MMTALSLLFRDPSIGADEVDSIDDAYAREERRARRETLAALDRMEAWLDLAGNHIASQRGPSDLPAHRRVAVAYSTVDGRRVGECFGYGRTTADAIEDLARRGANRGAW